MSVRISREPLSVHDFNSICRSVGWNPVAAENYELAINNSVACVSAFDGATPVGGGRLVGDVGMYLYIQDLVVVSERHGEGIGSRIAEELHLIVEEIDCQRGRVGLIAALEVCDFYEKLGYAESRPASRFLTKAIRRGG